MKRIFGGLADAMQSIAAVGIGIAVVLNLMQIIYRYVLFDPLSWTEEVMRYLMVWVTMLGVAASLYLGEEASAGFLGWIKVRRFQAALHWVRTALVLIFGLMLAWYGLPFALGAGTQVSPAAQIPVMWPYMAMFVGGVAILVMGLGMIIAPAAPTEGELRPEDIA